MPLDDQILGQGVYTPREAARLINDTPHAVLRWTRGSGAQQPVLIAHYDFLDDSKEISFRDLVEVRAISAMRRAGISLQAIRYAIAFAKNAFGIDRPLLSRRFQSDGKEILMDAVEQDGQLVSLSKNRPGQKVFREIVLQSLSDLEYEDDTVARWRPHKHNKIVLDPNRKFGDPITDDFSLSTSVLYSDFVNGVSTKQLANIYEVPEKLVKAAINFEADLDRASGSSSI